MAALRIAEGSKAIIITTARACTVLTLCFETFFLGKRTDWLGGSPVCFPRGADTFI